MSSDLKCDRCNSNVDQNWKYCRSCGNQLNYEDHYKKSTSEQEEENEIEEAPEVSQYEEFDKDLYYKVLSTRADRSVILQKKEEIRKEIDSLLEQLQSGLIGKETVLPKIKGLKEEVKEINKTNSEFSELPEELPIEVLNDEINAARKRLKKIDNLKSDENIGKDTIKEAKRRTEESINLLRDQQSQVFGHLRTWKSNLEEKIKDLRKEIEHLYVRFRTDEITEESYKEKKEEHLEILRKDQEVAKMLARILDN